MPIKLNGQTTGSVTLTAPATGSDVTVTIPSSTNSTIATSNTAFMLSSTINPSGRNKLINGDFSIWQRGTSFAPNGGEAYCADRWVASGVTACTQQAFSVGTTIDGINPTYFLRLARTSNPGNFPALAQRVEDVKTFAGQTVTFSFYAKTDSAFNAGTWRIGYFQSFGTGGSTGVGDFSVAAISPTASWVRYSATFSLPSVSGKTIGAGSFVAMFVRNDSDTSTSGQLDIWGTQLEFGSTATAFETEFIGDTLRKCQRYYYQSSSVYAAYNVFNSGNMATSYTPFPVAMRIAPAITPYDNAGTINRITVANAGGTSQNNIVPPNAPVISTDGWFYGAGGTTATQGNNGMIHMSRYIANAEL